MLDIADRLEFSKGMPPGSDPLKCMPPTAHTTSTARAPAGGQVGDLWRTRCAVKCTPFAERFQSLRPPVVPEPPVCSAVFFEGSTMPRRVRLV